MSAGPAVGGPRTLNVLIYEAYISSGAPALGEMARAVADNETLTGSPSRDTINRLIGDPSVPAKQADMVVLVSVLVGSAEVMARAAVGKRPPDGRRYGYPSTWVAPSTNLIRTASRCSRKPRPRPRRRPRSPSLPPRTRRRIDLRLGAWISNVRAGQASQPGDLKTVLAVLAMHWA